MDKYLNIDHPHYTRFPRDSRLNEIDKSISLSLAMLPFDVEPFLFIIYFFGHLFGTPLIAISVVPTVFLFHSNAKPSALLCTYGSVVFVVLVLVNLFVYANLCSRNNSFDFSGTGKITFLFAIGNLCVFKYFIADKIAYNLLCAYYFAWIVLNVSAWLSKVYFLRDRPAAYYGVSFLEDRVQRYKHNDAWKTMISKNSQGKNARHSFPSLDSAIAGCVLGLIVEVDNGSVFDSIANQVNSASLVAFSGDINAPTFPYHTVFCLCFLSFLMAMFGRIYVFAHHFVDVVVGGFIGLLFPIMLRSYFATLSPDVYHGTDAKGATYLYGEICLAWFIIYSVALATFFFVPKSGFFLAIFYVACARWFLGEFSVFTLSLFCAILFTLSRIFHVQSRTVKPWVVKTMSSYFNEIEDPMENWPDSLKQLLASKRIEFMEECSEVHASGAENIFPGDVYLSGKFIKTKHFACDWRFLKKLMLQRLDHFVESTGVNLSDIDLILGIYSGGAMLAPIIADELDLPLAFIKAKRYKGLNLNLVEFGYVALQRALGQHDESYKLSKLPDKEMIKGKNILMIDDACVSGGTFKAVAKFCMEECGCNEVRGLALAGSPSTSSHIWDPNMKNVPKMQKIHMPIFSPWGTF